MPNSPTFGAPPAIPASNRLQSLWPQIAATAAAQNPPVDPNVAYAMAATESGGNSSAVSNKGAVGLFQLTPGTAADMGFPDAMNPNAPDFDTQNINAGMKYMSNQLQTFGGDYNLALAAYNSGPGTVRDYMNGTNLTGKNPQELMTGGIPPFSETENYISKIDGLTGNPSGSMANSNPDQVEDMNTTATPYKALEGNDFADYKSLSPDVIVDTGLSMQPWYTDNSLITGNSRLRREVQPVTFKIYVGDNIDNYVLSNGGYRGKPIEIQLNASMKTHSVAMKHLYHQQRTRTGFHVTMWGMQADVIEGQCTTGVFMNQLGLTDYFSTFKPDTHLKQLLNMGGFRSIQNEEPCSVNPSTPNQVNGGSPASDTKVYDSVINALSRNDRNFKESSTFRVAAQDAFQEFLSLFKMNGTVWFYNLLYQNKVGSNRDWTGVQAWSPETGISSSQMNARNNDVMTRGTIQMQFRDTIYEGYFKSLQWTMEADTPFRWDFSFVFQVERTLGREYVPGTN